MDVGGDVGFTISDAAEAVIRDGGGELWIWASDDGKPCTSCRPSRLYRMAWTTYEADGLAIRVDSRIVPPWRWRLTAVEAEHEVAASWDGLDPRIFDRQPLEEDSPASSSSSLAHIGAQLVVPVVASAAFAVLWVLHLVGVTIEWLSVGHLLLTGAIAMVGWIAWVRRKHAELRADKALRAELERSPLPLRPLREDHARGVELG